MNRINAKTIPCNRLGERLKRRNGKDVPVIVLEQLITPHAVPKRHLNQKWEENNVKYVHKELTKNVTISESLRQSHSVWVFPYYVDEQHNGPVSHEIVHNAYLCYHYGVTCCR